MLTTIFCTYLNYETLADAVRALIASEGYDPSLCRILVVDNTPKDRRSTPDLPEGVNVICCDEPGLSNARNAGIAAATTEIIAFVDDDALVQDGWVPAVIEAFADPNVMICGGKTEPLYEAGELPPWWSDGLATHLSCIDWGDDLRPLEPGEWVVGANIAYRAETFERHGMFNPALGRQGNSGLLSNEETAIAAAVGPASTYYNPKMQAKHIISPERVTQSWFRKRVAWQAISDTLSGEGYIEHRHAWKLLGEHILSVPAEYRTTRSLYYPTDDPQAFASQLKAIYLHGILFCSGFTPVVQD